MKWRVCSDIHSEFWPFNPNNKEKLRRVLEICLPVHEDDKQTTLVVAGDLGSIRSRAMLRAVCEVLSDRFQAVLWIPGNHEYYGGSLMETEQEIKEMVKDLKNINFGQQIIHGIAGPNIHMATLWTNYNGGDKESMQFAYQCMNDCRAIGSAVNVKEKTNPYELMAIHEGTVQAMVAAIEPGDLVITHHLPSFKSIDESFKGTDYEALNPAYASDLEALILAKKPKLWIHGHTHKAKDYMIGETRILCNPRGYDTSSGPECKTNGYNPNLTVEFPDYVV